MMNKQTHIHLGWPVDKRIFNILHFLANFFLFLEYIFLLIIILNVKLIRNVFQNNFLNRKFKTTTYNF